MSEKNYKYRMKDVITEEMWDCTDLGTLVRIMNGRYKRRTKTVKVAHDMEAVGKFSQYPFYIVYINKEYPPIATNAGIGYNYYHTQAEMWRAKSEGLHKLFDNVNTPVYMLEAIADEMESCDAQWRHYMAEANDIKSWEDDDDEK